jgi:hypothetical protein
MRVAKCLMLLLAAGALAFALLRAHAWLEVDSCLDSGGRWNAKFAMCERNERL